jgi:hypothetical protein
VIVMERLKTAAEAEAEGFTIDRTAAGCWWAYKGARFGGESSEGFEVETERETALRERAESAEACLALRITAPIDTRNDFAVSAQGSGILLLRPPAPGQAITREQALRLAAWIVALCGGWEAFEPVLAAVEST